MVSLIDVPDDCRSGQLRVQRGDASGQTGQHLTADVVHDDLVGASARPSAASRATSAGAVLGPSRSRDMSVSMPPTCSPATRMPWSASWTRRELVSDHWADLAAQ
ncbi:hypothetical protein HEP87_57830 [Streptomyces sp. S1D4-11]